MSNPFDMSALADMVGGFQQKLADMKASAAKIEATGEAGGGAVKVVANGENQLVSISIAASAMDDHELLEDLIRAAANEALRKAQASSAGKLSELAAGLPLPPGLLG